MSIGILTIATNKYINYWMSMVESYLKVCSDSEENVFYVFTDEEQKAREFSDKYPKLNIQIIEVENMGFPEATLRRYEIYYKYKELLKNEVLMHLDADMLIRDKSFVQIETLAQESANGIALVSHPGYWRPHGISRIKLYLRNPKLMAKDLVMLFHVGGIGAWEKDKGSTAFVPRKYRQNYICGGIWIGKNLVFKELCKELAQKTKLDFNLGKIPIWHDESFLNQWASTHKFNLLDSGFCFDPRYPQLAGLTNIVEAVDKNAL